MSLHYIFELLNNSIRFEKKTFLSWVFHVTISVKSLAQFLSCSNDSIRVNYCCYVILARRKFPLYFSLFWCQLPQWAHITLHNLALPLFFILSLCLLTLHFLTSQEKSMCFRAGELGFEPQLGPLASSSVSLGRSLNISSSVGGQWSCNEGYT